MTLLSRLLGFVRDMLIAQLFGVNFATDAFFAVFKLPNFLRRLFVEGAFAQSFVPALIQVKHQQPKKLNHFIANISGTFLVILSIITLMGVLFAPFGIGILATGFLKNTQQYTLATFLLRLVFPYLFFITLVAIAGSIFNAYEKFAIPAITPIILNITMILAAVWLAPYFQQPVIALGWGVFIAGFLQLFLQLPFLKRLNCLPKPRVAFNNPDVKKVTSSILPLMFGVSVTQINLLFNTWVASFLPIGSVSWLYYSDRLVEFPLGLFGVTVATVVLPQLAKNYANQNEQAFSRTLDWGLRLTLLLTVPATVGLFFLAKPILFTLFQYNAFSAQDVELASGSLSAYALGLVGFVLIKLFIPALTSRHDTKMLLRFGVYTVIANLIFIAILTPYFAHIGLALATSLSAFFNAGLLFFYLRKKHIYQPEKGWLIFSLRLLISSGLLAAFLIFFSTNLDWQLWDKTARLLTLLKLITGGIVVYLMVLFTLGFRLKQLRIQ